MMKKTIVFIIILILGISTVIFLIPSLFRYLSELNNAPEKSWYKILYTILQIGIAAYFIIKGIQYLKHKKP
ncbi:hypothetical protein [Aquimarina sp. LLG6339-5]|uniref:hypothetical protein n=1 Tax=Aquimarina sp. LLG6339-5 TaxID=3160830 RepID=UPI00386AF4BF